MKLYVWYDKGTAERLLSGINLSPYYLVKRFPERHLVREGEVRISNPMMQKLGSRILKDQSFLWIKEEAFHDFTAPYLLTDEQLRYLMIEAQRKHQKDLERLIMKEDEEFERMRRIMHVSPITEDEMSNCNVEVRVKKTPEFRPIWLYFKEKEDFDMLMMVLHTDATGNVGVEAWRGNLERKIIETLAKTEGVIP